MFILSSASVHPLIDLYSLSIIITFSTSQWDTFSLHELHPVIIIKSTMVPYSSLHPIVELYAVLVNFIREILSPMLVKLQILLRGRWTHIPVIGPLRLSSRHVLETDLIRCDKYHSVLNKLRVSAYAISILRLGAMLPLLTERHVTHLCTACPPSFVTISCNPLLHTEKLK